MCKNGWMTLLRTAMRACVCARAQRPVVCDIVRVVTALAILMSFSGLKHFDDNAIKW